MPNISLPTSDQVNSFMRHVYTGVGVATGTLIIVGLSQGDASTIGVAVHKIGDGVSSIIAGVTLLIPIASGLYAAWSASPFSRMMWMKKNDQIKQVIAVPGTAMGAIANSIPGDKVTAK